MWRVNATSKKKVSMTSWKSTEQNGSSRQGYHMKATIVTMHTGWRGERVVLLVRVSSRGNKAQTENIFRREPSNFQ